MYGKRYPDWGWCWRCNQEVALLNATQISEMPEVISEAKRIRKAEGTDLQQAMNAAGKARIKHYEETTGCKLNFGDEEVGALALHLVSHQTRNYGIPCTNCGKLLRSSKASYCADCGFEESAQTFIQDRNK